MPVAVSYGCSRRNFRTRGTESVGRRSIHAHDHAIGNAPLQTLKQPRRVLDALGRLVPGLAPSIPMARGVRSKQLAVRGGGFVQAHKAHEHHVLVQYVPFLVEKSQYRFAVRAWRRFLRPSSALTKLPRVWKACPPTSKSWGPGCSRKCAWAPMANSPRTEPNRSVGPFDPSPARKRESRNRQRHRARIACRQHIRTLAQTPAYPRGNG